MFFYRFCLFLAAFAFLLLLPFPMVQLPRRSCFSAVFAFPEGSAFSAVFASLPFLPFPMVLHRAHLAMQKRPYCCKDSVFYLFSYI